MAKILIQTDDGKTIASFQDPTGNPEVDSEEAEIGCVARSSHALLSLLEHHDIAEAIYAARETDDRNPNTGAKK